MSDLPLANVPENIHTAGVGMVTFGEDSRLVVRFYKKPMINGYKTELEGMPVYEQIDMVSIRQPGERDDLHREAKPSDHMRFPRQWAAYVAGQEQTVEGTPIEVMFPGDDSIVPMLKSMKITTLEQMAEATEPAIQRMGMGARAWVTKAKQLLDGMAGGKATVALQNQVSALQLEREQMEQRLKDLTDRVAEMAKRRAKRAELEEVE